MHTVAPEHTAFCRKDRLEVAVRSLRSPTDHGRRENQDNYLVVDGQGRGRHVTSAVVQSGFLIIMFDAIFAVIFMVLGL